MAEPQTEDFLAMLEKWNAVRRPLAPHAVLNRLAGEWDVLLRFHGGDQAWESRCGSRAEVLHDGRFLLEQIHGEMYVPDEQGEMRPEPYSATRMLGFDNYKKAFSGVFVDNQNTSLLAFLGHDFSEGEPESIRLFGAADEPMLDTHDAMMKYELSFPDEARHVWSVAVLAVGDGARLFEFEYSRRG